MYNTFSHPFFQISVPRSTASIFAPHHVTENLTVIIPAYNEERTIVDTIKSLKNQTRLPKSVIVVDDFSTDQTGLLAKAQGVTVIRPPKNTGSKAGAQNVALKTVRTTYAMALDADTILASDAIEKLSRAFRNKEVAAASGFVIPRYIKSVWERGRAPCPLHAQRRVLPDRSRDIHTHEKTAASMVSRIHPERSTPLASSRQKSIPWISGCCLGSFIANHDNRYHRISVCAAPSSSRGHTTSPTHRDFSRALLS